MQFSESTRIFGQDSVKVKKNDGKKNKATNGWEKLLALDGAFAPLSGNCYPARTAQLIMAINKAYI